MTNEVQGMHLSAASGALSSLEFPVHFMPLETSSTPTIVATARRPLRTDNILANATFGTATRQAETLRPLGPSRQSGSLEEARHKAEGLFKLVAERQASMLAFDRLFLMMGWALLFGSLSVGESSE